MEPKEQAGLVAARAVMQRAHAPYSGFHVGAAIVMSDGEIFVGCNVESASYGLTLCAERSGLSAAIAARGSLGPSSVSAVVITTESDSPTPPCGACRQWLAEFAPLATVLSVAGNGTKRTWTVKELLPAAFTGDQLT
jgi:cytidine deaminase